MGHDEARSHTAQARRRRVDRERVLRTLTFWLRPYFVLRVVNRFQKIVGFDRAIALASSALTATIPLAIVTSIVAQQVGGKSAADRIIDRYNLSAGGAEAVKDIFSPPSGTETSLGVVGVFFLMIAVLSFTRALQRLFEQTWELKPLSVRNSLNGLTWVGGLVLYSVAGTAIHAVLHYGRLDLVATLVYLPFSALFFGWTGWILSARRISPAQLVPFAVLGSALEALYSIGATLYLPHLFDTYATRYGVIGAVFAMISALFCLMVVLVASAAAGREVHEELIRVRRGQRPADDEVRREWDQLIAEAQSRWESGRRQFDRRRR